MLRNFAKTILIPKPVTPVTTAESPTNNSEQDGSNASTSDHVTKNDDVNMPDINMNSSASPSPPSSKAATSTSRSPTACANSDASPENNVD